MNPQFTDKIVARKKQQSVQSAQNKRTAAVMNAVTLSSGETVKAIKDLSKKASQITDLITQLNNKDTSVQTDLNDKLAVLLEKFVTRLETIQKIDLKDLPEVQKKLAKSLDSFPRSFDFTDGSERVVEAVESLKDTVKGIKTNPQVTVTPAPVNVEVPAFDITPITKALEGLKQPDVNVDLSSLQEGISSVETAIRDLIARPIPVPETPLPFKNTSNQGVQVQLTADGKVPVDASFSGTIEGAAAFSDSSDVDKKGLVDADRHLQVDVLTMPSISVDPPEGGATEAKQDTIIGHIDGIETLLTTIESNQLPDSHNVTVDNASIAVTGTFWQATQPVSAASLPLPTGAATSANQSTANTSLSGINSDTTAIKTAVEGTLDVNVVSGGGAQYTEGDTDASITGTALLWEDSSDTLRAVSASKPLPVDITDSTIAVTDNGGSLTVDGTVSVTGVSTSAKQDTIIGHLDGVEGSLTTLAGAVSGTEMQVDVLSMPTTTVQATNLDIRDLNSASDSVTIVPSGTQTVSGTVTANLSATDNTVLDNIDSAVTSKYITGIGHGVKTVTTAGTDVALASSTACKKVTIQAQTDNTGLIAVGGTGVDATEATGTGIILYPGDSFEFDIDNLADVYIDATVNGEGVRFAYFT